MGIKEKMRGFFKPMNDMINQKLKERKENQELQKLEDEVYRKAYHLERLKAVKVQAKNDANNPKGKKGSGFMDAIQNASQKFEQEGMDMFGNRVKEGVFSPSIKFREDGFTSSSKRRRDK